MERDFFSLPQMWAEGKAVRAHDIEVIETNVITVLRNSLSALHLISTDSTEWQLNPKRIPTPPRRHSHNVSYLPYLPLTMEHRTWSICTDSTRPRGLGCEVANNE